MKSHRILSLGAALLLSPVALWAQGGQVVGPGGQATLGNFTDWIVTQFAGGYAQVTTNAPRTGYGDLGYGSLELAVTGEGSVQDGFPDWAFWYRYAGGDAATTINNGMSFGSLRDLTSLSFDWYRSFVDGWNDTPPEGEQPINPVDWLYKTPVLRLQLVETHGDQTFQSELVWEGYYNQASIGPDGTPIDQWVSQTGMQNDNFWYVRPPDQGTGAGSSIANGACSLGVMSFWAGSQSSNVIDQLFGADGCFADASVQVIGIGIGVGSQWPVEWRGFADNIQMSFNGVEELNANFDFHTSTVPEPSTYALMALGLGAVGVMARRRRSR